MTCAFLDCFSGIAGDMLLGAFIDCGLDEKQLGKQLGKLELSGYTVHIDRVQKGAISATRVLVKTTEQHHHRSHADIQDIIKTSGLSTSIQNTALAIFSTLAKAEAAIHGVAKEDIHFHEVGGIDSIIDIVGTAIAIDILGIKTVVISPLPMGHGWVECQHGKLPLPAPAVVKLCEGLAVYGVDETKELVTPTGAAIARTLATSGAMPNMTISATGYGAGNHNLDHPNVLRLVLGKKRNVHEAQEIEVIECNLDDWSPEPFPHLCDQLLDQGALDVSLIPIQMKKGRPGFLLRVLASLHDAQRLKEAILSETSAIGLRFHREQRMTLPRKQVTVTCQYGDIIAKQVETPTGKRIYPEYEECRKVAQQQNLPIIEVYTAVLRGNAQ
jgi:uncharacterized protein (TIGR00299 family) protein